jgi:hypothetical protein
MSAEKEKTFFCRDCHHSWRTKVCEYHDDIAYSGCPNCNTPQHEVPHYYFNLPQMMEAQKGKHTGPKTEEGKKRVSLNGFKHGLYTSQKTILAPAKKDKYPECEGCPYRDKCEIEYKYCPVNLSLFMKFAQAYADGQIKELQEIAGMMQGKALTILGMLYNDVFKEGTTKERRYITNLDKESNEETVVLEIQTHPALRRIPEFHQLLGFTADQQNMTPAKSEEVKTAKGFLNAEESKNVNLNEFVESQKNELSKIKESLIKAAKLRNNDEAYQNYKKEIDGADNGD